MVSAFTGRMPENDDPYKTMTESRVQRIDFNLSRIKMFPFIVMP